MWVRPYGPPRVIESDQEGGLVNDEAKTYLAHIGTELKEKGVNAHARMVEKHHEECDGRPMRKDCGTQPISC